MFEGPVTGNIPGTHVTVTAGQLALALTPYAQVTDLAVNTAASGNNAAAIQSLDDRVTAELASKLDSSALAPAIAPLATAAALATTDGQVAAHGSSIAALQSSLTTGLSNKADQSAFDVLEGVVATKSTPDGVDLKLSNYSTTAAMNGSIASANNATLATVAANYGLKTVVDQHSLDIAARITPLKMDTKVANALLGAVTAAALASELASQDASISGLQASKADASALTAYALQSAVDTSSEVDSKIATALLDAVTAAALDAALLGKADASALASLLSTVDGLDTPLEVDTKIANALLGLATEAFVAAQLASRGTPASRRSRGPRPTRRCWPHTPRSRAPSTQSSRSSPPCSFPAAAELLTRRPGRASRLGSSFAEVTSFATCIWGLLSLLQLNSKTQHKTTQFAYMRTCFFSTPCTLLCLYHSHVGCLHTRKH